MNTITKNGTTFESLADFLKCEFTFRSPVVEYFCYHPPDEKRTLKHEQINKMAKQSYWLLVKSLEDSDSYECWRTRVSIIDDLNKFAFEICDDLLCIQWALRSINNVATNSETTLMYMQQYRMFLNQGVTIDSIHKRSGVNPLCS